MKSIRFNVFETNSSSQHSLSVIDEQKFFNPLKPLDESILFFSYGGVTAYNEDFGKRRRGLLEDDPLRKKVQDEFFKILTEFHSDPKKLEGYRPELKKVNSLKEMAEFFLKQFKLRNHEENSDDEIKDLFGEVLRIFGVPSIFTGFIDRLEHYDHLIFFGEKSRGTFSSFYEIGSEYLFEY